MASVEILVDSNGAAGFGHTYIKLTDDNGNSSYWGFYSDENDTLGGLDMLYDDGVVLDETSRKDWSIREESSSIISSYTISDVQYTNINNYIQYRKSNPGNYFILGDAVDGADNCASFVSDVLSAGGIENAFDNVPNGFTQNSAWFNWMDFTPEERAQYITAGGLPWTYSENDYATFYNDGTNTLIIDNNNENISIIVDGGNFEVWEKDDNEFINTTETYTIQSGDTLWDIAQENNTTVDKIIEDNPWLSEENRISEDGSYVLIKPEEKLNLTVDDQTKTYEIDENGEYTETTPVYETQTETDISSDPDDLDNAKTDTTTEPDNNEISEEELDEAIQQDEGNRQSSDEEDEPSDEDILDGIDTEGMVETVPVDKVDINIAETPDGEYTIQVRDEDGSLSTYYGSSTNGSTLVLDGNQSSPNGITFIDDNGVKTEWQQTHKINTFTFFWYQNKVTKKNTLQGTKSPKGSLKNLNTQKRLRNSLRLNSPRLLSFEYLNFLALCNARDGYGSAEALFYDMGLKEVA